MPKAGIFSTNVDAENQTLINHKCVCGALNRHFCQTRVSTSPFFSVVFVRYHFVSVLVRWLGDSFAKLGFSVGLCSFANVPPNALAMLSYILFSSLCHFEFLKICLFGLVFQVLKSPLLSSVMACKLYHSRV